MLLRGQVNGLAVGHCKRLRHGGVNACGEGRIAWESASQREAEPWAEKIWAAFVAAEVYHKTRARVQGPHTAAVRGPVLHVPVQVALEAKCREHPSLARLALPLLLRLQAESPK